MQFSVILALSLAGAASAGSWLKSLTEYTNEIPSCAAVAFKTGMKNQGCDVVNVDAKDFDCLCDHYGKIEGRVYLDVEPSCSADFATAAGLICGAWAVEGTSASDLPQAIQALAAKLGAN